MLHDEIIQSLWKQFGSMAALETKTPEELDELFQRHDKEMKEGGLEHSSLILKNTYLLGYQALKQNPTAVYFQHEPLDIDGTLDPALVQTAREFFHAGILRLPYDCILMIIELDKLGASNKPLKIPMILSEVDNADKGGIQALLLQSANQEYDKPVVQLAAQAERGQDIIRFFPFSYEAQKNDTENARTVKIVIDFALTCVLKMSMPHYRQEQNSPPEKVNQKRIKTGKAPLRGWTKVSLRPEIMQQLNRGSSSQGWTVRPHWRRGHIRTLQDGRKVPVRPCMVNWEGDTALEKNIYFIDAGEKHAEAV